MCVSDMVASIGTISDISICTHKHTHTHTERERAYHAQQKYKYIERADAAHTHPVLFAGRQEGVVDGAVHLTHHQKPQRVEPLHDPVVDAEELGAPNVWEGR